MLEGLVNKLDTLATDERTRIIGLNMWVREVETVDHIWKMDVKNTAILMNELMNRRNWEDTQTTMCQPERCGHNELPSRDKNRDENCYHLYHSCSDHDCDQDHGYKHCNNDHNNQNHRYLWTGDNNHNGQDHPWMCDNGYNRNNNQRTFNNRTNERNYDHPKRCPPLMQNECDLLHNHDSCNKCHKFYTDCGRNCENWLDAHFYQTLTLQDALDAKSRKINKPDNRNAVTATMPHADFNNVYNASMAALLGNNPSYNMPRNMYDNNKAEWAMSALPMSHIHEVNAILPSSSIPFNLGSGSDTSDKNAFNCEVSKAPLIVDHLTWDANVFGRNEFPTTINCLLDNGAHLILIRPETITDLMLPIRKLETLISVTLALEGKKTISVFHDYVYLQLASGNNEWMSKTVCALLAPGLCSNILLGLLFLAHNNIVIDHTAHTVIDKELGFDLNSRMP